MKLTNSYKLVSFNVLVFTTYKRCHTITIKLTNLCCIKIYELKALDCRLKAMSAFLIERYTINLKNLFL
ncbi:hypothetical protein ABEZ32_27875 [Bacillus mycoides]|uniref:hypothetical protein n=1 Tax=Bacillus mycoides TaxID=1405 RepID=UPI003D1E7617